MFSINNKYNYLKKKIKYDHKEKIVLKKKNDWLNINNWSLNT